MVVADYMPDPRPSHYETEVREAVSHSRTPSTGFRYHLHLRHVWRDFMDSILNQTRNLTDNHV
jgi:hypothetical protein